MGWIRSGCASVIVIGMLLSSSATAFADDKNQPSAAALDEARDRFTQGLKLYDDGAYEASRVQFERAYQLAPSYKILYNIGLTYKQLNEFVGARTALQQYLSQGGNEVPPERREEVTKLLAELDRIIAYVSVTTNVPGVEISVDDVVVGKTPLSDKIPLNPGRRKISGKLQGRMPDSKVITLASRDKVDVALNLAPPPTMFVEKPPRRVPWIGWIATGALAIGTGIFGVLALTQNSKLSDEKAKLNPNADDLKSRANTVSAYAIVTDIFGGATLVAGGVSAYLTIKWGNEDNSAASAQNPAAPPSSDTTKTSGMLRPVGFELVGRF